jgi:hypothetical protein
MASTTNSPASSMAAMIITRKEGLAHPGHQQDARMRLLAYELDAEKYRGRAHGLKAFGALTHFSRSQY